jgi:hypothetical protein
MGYILFDSPHGRLVFTTPTFLRVVFVTLLCTAYETPSGFVLQSIRPVQPANARRRQSIGDRLLASGDTDRAANMLTTTLECISSPADAGHPVRLELLGTLGELLLEQRHPQQSAGIFGELKDCCTRHSGPNHPSSLAAKGDLAVALFAMGKTEEAESLEKERPSMPPGSIWEPGIPSSRF